MSHLFGTEMMRQKNVWTGILIFGPQTEKNGQKGRAGRPCSKNFRIWTFSIKETPAQIGCGYFVILCSFVRGATLWAAGVPAGGPRAENYKLEFGLFA